MIAPQKKILVVEDNRINRAVLTQILSEAYEVVEAENGQEAMDILFRLREEISLILLDLIMPVMDGYTFLERVKSEPDVASIPVIVTTQQDNENDEVTALAHGAADFVTKPYKPQVILHRVASIINLRENAAMINRFRYDPLTGLYSKEFFYRRVREWLAQHPEREYDLLCSDIENFKLINDVFGVPAGDHLLQEVAQHYVKMVGKSGICGRFNADQFVCLWEHRDTYDDETFLKASAQINALSNTKPVSIKWGIYRIHDRQVPVEKMCDRALLAASSIKGHYRRQFAVYDDELRSQMLREQSITDSMEAALLHGQFFVLLQPKYRVRDGLLAGAEALVRWNHPEWGCMSPAEFIPLFERNGFITRLDQFVWETVCGMLREWQDKGYPTIPVSVNVSRADVYQADLAGLLLRMVQRHGLHPSQLHLEITESAYTEDPEQIVSTVVELRRLGFVIEMDDFGSGYSSLNMLNQMTLDILKLDMKFIQSETTKPMDQGILRFIMSLARWMELGVVAEGVETRDQLDRLREVGCDYVQGYYFSRPIPKAEFEALLQRQGRASIPDLPEDRPCQRGEVLLVADEDPAYRQWVWTLFQNRYRVLEVDSAEEAVARVTGQEETVAAVVLSLTMPGGGGLRALKTLRGEQTAWQVPILATGPHDERLEEQALSLGAEDYAGKPHTGRSIQQRLTRLLGHAAARERERLLQDEACRDYLTGLLNRRGLYTAMSDLREEELPMALYLFDMDELKRVNDGYGHGAGDRMLTAFGELLRRHARGTDLLARYGGDEFIVVMKHMNAESDVLKKGSAICAACRKIALPGGLPAACSAGIVRAGQKGEPLDALIAKADQALYRAKAEKKGGCCLWKEGEAEWIIQ